MGIRNVNHYQISELKTTSGHLLLATYPASHPQVRSGMDGCEKLLELCREKGFTIAHSRSHRYGTLVKSELAPRLNGSKMSGDDLAISGPQKKRHPHWKAWFFLWGISTSYH